MKKPARWCLCHQPEPTQSAGGPSVGKTRLRRRAHREWEKRLSPPATPWRTAHAKLLGLSCRESVETARLPGHTSYSTLLRANMCPLIIRTRIHFYATSLHQQVLISNLLGSSMDLSSVCLSLNETIGDTRSACDVFAQALSLIIVDSTSMLRNARAFRIWRRSAASEVTISRPLQSSCLIITLKSIVRRR